MKKFIIILVNLSITLNLMAAGVGGSSGGGTIDPSIAQMSLNLDDLRFFSNATENIDNIEINDEIRYPQSILEKLRLLKDYQVQSIQMKNGDVIRVKEI